MNKIAIIDAYAFEHVMEARTQASINSPGIEAIALFEEIGLEGIGLFSAHDNTDFCIAYDPGMVKLISQIQLIQMMHDFYAQYLSVITPTHNLGPSSNLIQ